MVEEWKDIIGYEGIYKISNLGKIIRIKGTKIRPMKIWNNGRYMEVRLSKEGKATHFTLHRLLAIHFIPNPNNLPSVNHKDENKLNNSINNLEWCTQEYNTNYGSGISRRVQSRLLSKAGRKPIVVLDETSEMKTVYQTVKDCVDTLHISSATIYKYIDTGISYKGKRFNHYE